jgi:hypothetical protein
MIGDKNLVQNGIRTSFGLVGDVGELPFGNASTLNGLKYLVANPSPAYPNWNGPYLSGFDPETYAVDAWGRHFIYSLRNDLDGYGNRHLSGELRSSGIDGIPGNSDDIVVELRAKDVAPTYRMQGNITFSNLTGSYYAKITVKFKDPLKPQIELNGLSMCTPVFPNYTTIIRDGATPMNVPIGKANIIATLHKKTDCSEPSLRSSSLDFFVSDSISSLLVNLPTTP